MFESHYTEAYSESPSSYPYRHFSRVEFISLLDFSKYVNMSFGNSVLSKYAWIHFQWRSFKYTRGGTLNIFLRRIFKASIFLLAKVLMAHLLECEMVPDSSWGKKLIIGMELLIKNMKMTRTGNRHSHLFRPEIWALTLSGQKIITILLCPW